MADKAITTRKPFSAASNMRSTNGIGDLSSELSQKRKIKGMVIVIKCCNELKKNVQTISTA